MNQINRLYQTSYPKHLISSRGSPMKFSGRSHMFPSKIPPSKHLHHLQLLVCSSNGLFQVQVLLQSIHLLQEPQRLAAGGWRSFPSKVHDSKTEADIYIHMYVMYICVLSPQHPAGIHIVSFRPFDPISYRNL